MKSQEQIDLSIYFTPEANEAFRSFKRKTIENVMKEMIELTKLAENQEVEDG